MRLSQDTLNGGRSTYEQGITYEKRRVKATPIVSGTNFLIMAIFMMILLFILLNVASLLVLP
jgi:uncharacterized protein YqhQ